jgi:hypothetical protein
MEELRQVKQGATRDTESEKEREREWREREGREAEKVGDLLDSGP